MAQQPAALRAAAWAGCTSPFRISCFKEAPRTTAAPLSLTPLQVSAV